VVTSCLKQNFKSIKVYMYVSHDSESVECTKSKSFLTK
jgi:hypothetical protein